MEIFAAENFNFAQAVAFDLSQPVLTAHVIITGAIVLGAMFASFAYLKALQKAQN